MTSCFYGGERGGGKSDFQLGYQEDAALSYEGKSRGIMFRKTYAELEELQARACQVFPASGAVYKTQPSADYPLSNCWYWPNGATVKMRYIENERDYGRYHGHQYCVEVGTLILMADGSGKRIDEIKIGDYVATLEGAKRVTCTIQPYIAPCVALHGDGVNQIHPAWHPVLTSSGWQSYASILGIDSKEFEEKFPESSRHPSVSLTVKRAASVPLMDRQCQISIQSPCACKPDLRTAQKSPTLMQRVLSYIYDLLPLFSARKRYEHCSPRAEKDDVQLDVVNDLQQDQGLTGDYCSCSHQYDGQFHAPLDSDSIEPPSQSCAASHSHAYCKLDVLGSIPSHSRQTEYSYQHPYALMERETGWESSLSACEMSFVGMRLVADITVEDANHYITFKQGAINKNTHMSFDEVTEYPTPAGLLKMLSTLRSAYGVPCTVRATGNPGGIGHSWVKQRYIDVAPPYTPYNDPDTGFTRMFIPSKTSDNTILLANDPKYRNRILAATGGNEALRKAWLEGDWDIVAGAFFDCWDRTRHVVKPFQIPDHWLRFRSGDWGSARPFSFGWFAVVADDFKHGDLILPRGCLVRYREWYGQATDDSGNPKYNVGLKMVAESVGSRLAEIEAKDNVSYGVLDPAAFSQDGGPSIHERIMLGSGSKVVFRRADNKRVATLGALGGWDQMRSRLIGEAAERPMLVFFENCIDSIRTIPLLQHDKDNIEDVDTDGEDHAADDVRYACMSRPWIKESIKEVAPKFDTQLTINQLIQRHARRLRNE